MERSGWPNERVACLLYLRSTTEFPADPASLKHDAVIVLVKQGKGIPFQTCSNQNQSQSHNQNHRSRIQIRRQPIFQSHHHHHHKINEPKYEYTVVQPRGCSRSRRSRSKGQGILGHRGFLRPRSDRLSQAPSRKRSKNHTATKQINRHILEFLGSFWPHGAHLSRCLSQARSHGGSGDLPVFRSGRIRTSDRKGEVNLSLSL